MYSTPVFYCIGILFSTISVHAMQSSVPDRPPLLFFSDVADEWCLVDDKEPVFKNIETLLVQVKEVQEAASEAQDVYNQQKDSTLVLLRRASPDFCREVRESLHHNFKDTGINPERVYEHIGLPFEKSKYMTHTQILSHLKKLHISEKINDKQYRQLVYPFKTAESKEEYDALHTNSLEALQCEAEEAIALRKAFERTIKYGIILAEIHRICDQFEELKAPSCDPGDDN
jgi:hypothetical protein